MLVLAPKLLVVYIHSRKNCLLPAFYMIKKSVKASLQDYESSSAGNGPHKDEVGTHKTHKKSLI